MKLYIHADMEGASGIMFPQQTDVNSARYENARQFLINDINVVVQIAKEAGADDIVVCDTHFGGFSGGQIDLTHMHADAEYESWNYGRILPSLDASYAGVVLLAHHAKAGTLNGFLDHTVSSQTIFDYKINGKSVGELGIEAAVAGHFDVPVIMVSGDDKTAEEARALFGDVECAVVKYGLSRNRARCLSMEKAHAVLRDTMSRALESIDRFKPFKPDLPATVEVTYCRSDFADEAQAKCNGERVDSRTVRRTIASLKELPAL